MKHANYRMLMAFGALGLVACQSQAPATSATTPRSAQWSPAVRAPIPGLSIDVGLSSVALEVRQRRALETIHAQLDAATEPVRRTERQLMGSLADAAAANKVDVEALRAQVRAIMTVAAQSGQRVERALDELHAMLTPEQRALVRGRYSQRWASAPTTAEWAPRLGNVLEPLGASREQIESARARLQAARPAPPLTEEDHAHHRVMMNAFHGDTFDAHALGVGDAYVRATLAAAEQTIAVVAAVVPDLTTEQRLRFAQMLRGMTTRSM
ncbi:MAG: Spy/CpxP family protein refolding chaperone [Labilithrix sp.]|nr:Spy/CpxP family protein refolding chaperone [Labilithrix sp.]